MDYGKPPQIYQPYRQKLKAFKKASGLDDSFDSYKAAYGNMPSHATDTPVIQQMYINEYFCYAYKFGMITNGLGIVQDIPFYNKDFPDVHPDTIVRKKYGSPDEDNSLSNSKALIPVLRDFLKKHPLINFKAFLGNTAFDSLGSVNTFYRKFLLKKHTFHKKLKVEGIDYMVNKEEIHCCLNDPSLPMRQEGSKSPLRWVFRP